MAYPAGRRTIAIGRLLEIEERPPSDDEREALASAQRVMAGVGATALVLLVITAAAMAAARYWPLILG